MNEEIFFLTVPFLCLAFHSICSEAAVATLKEEKPIWRMFQKELENYRTGKWSCDIKGRTDHCLVLHPPRQWLLCTEMMMAVLITFAQSYKSFIVQVPLTSFSAPLFLS